MLTLGEVSTHGGISCGNARSTLLLAKVRATLHDADKKELKIPSQSASLQMPLRQTGDGTCTLDRKGISLFVALDFLRKRSICTRRRGGCQMRLHLTDPEVVEALGKHSSMELLP